MSKRTSPHFVMCVRNDEYRASLEPRKVYRVVPDAQATSIGHLRVVDESGEDYLYPADLFVPVSLSTQAVQAFAKSS